MRYHEMVAKLKTVTSEEKDDLIKELFLVLCMSPSKYSVENFSKTELQKIVRKWNTWIDKRRNPVMEGKTKTWLEVLEKFEAFRISKKIKRNLGRFSSYNKDYTKATIVLTDFINGEVEEIDADWILGIASETTID